MMYYIEYFKQEKDESSTRQPRSRLLGVSQGGVSDGMPWLRTNGADTNGAAAKVMTFDRLRKMYALALLGR